ncbi:MAG TPA: amidohydrolase [Steroidobacteraceae bacterium]|nr:amidohydrolase [Steroidobacteraceae bacterium]
MPKLLRLVPFVLLACGPAGAAVDDAAVEAATKSVMPQVITWRRDFHQNPELSNREVRTSRVVAEQLRKLGLEVRTGIAHTGVAAILRGAKPGPTVALRADMDALPVTEQLDVPFKSVATAEYRGEKVGVMHACGHDGHTAILLGVARILSAMRNELPGTVVFVFQPAEEGAPDGERGGASLMLDEGLFAATKPEAMFGLHLWSALNVGAVGYRTGPLMAASDRFRIVVRGRQTHGSRPWGGVDPIVTAAQIVTSLQTIVARQVDITQYPVVVSVGAIKGGIRNNIIPDSVEMVGTFRTFDPEVREQVIERIRRIATETAAAAGATAEFELGPDPNPVVVNEPALTTRAVATLERVAGKDHVAVMPYVTGSEDFAFYARQMPTFYYFVGSTPQGQDPATAPSNHSPRYFLDEAALPLGVSTLTALALDYLQGVTSSRAPR